MSADFSLVEALKATAHGAIIWGDDASDDRGVVRGKELADAYPSMKPRAPRIDLATAAEKELLARAYPSHTKGA